jgi:hypothetical protein
MEKLTMEKNMNRKRCDRCKFFASYQVTSIKRHTITPLDSNKEPEVIERDHQTEFLCICCVDPKRRYLLTPKKEKPKCSDLEAAIIECLQDRPNRNYINITFEVNRLMGKGPRSGESCAFIRRKLNAMVKEGKLTTTNKHDYELKVEELV